MKTSIARFLALICLAAAGGLFVAACGSDDDQGSSSETGVVAESTETPEAATPADPLDPVTEALQSAGFKVNPEPPSDADSAIMVDQLVSVSYYQDPAQAKKVGRDISGVYKQFPGRGIVVSQGNLVIDMGQERTLKPQELAKFNQVAAAAMKASDG